MLSTVAQRVRAVLAEVRHASVTLTVPPLFSQAAQAGRAMSTLTGSKVLGRAAAASSDVSSQAYPISECCGGVSLAHFSCDASGMVAAGRSGRPFGRP